LGRFITPDWAAKATAVPYANFGNPQSLNLYSYVTNNPMTVGDPDGHQQAVANAIQSCATSAPCVTTAAVAGSAAADALLVGGVAFGPGALGMEVVIASPPIPFQDNLILDALTPTYVPAPPLQNQNTNATAPPTSQPPANSGSTQSSGSAQNGNKGTSGGPRAGKPMTPKGKREVKAANAAQNGGQTTCERCGQPTVPAQQSQAGVTPPGNETHVDHIIPQSKNGDGSPSNGQVLCRTCNLDKSDKVPQ
jgi:5-methylcytosine-specific restriction endonuclease McrA